MKCPDCKGSGKIELLTSVVTCDACGGSGLNAESLDRIGEAGKRGSEAGRQFGKLPAIGEAFPAYVDARLLQQPRELACLKLQGWPECACPHCVAGEPLPPHYIDFNTPDCRNYRVTCDGVELEKCTAADAVEGWAEVLDIAAFVPGMDEVPRKLVHGKVRIERVTERGPEGLGSVVAYARSQQPLRLPATFVRMAEGDGHDCFRFATQLQNTLNSKPWRGHEPLTAYAADVQCNRQEDGRWRVQTRIDPRPWTGEPFMVDGTTGKPVVTEEQWRELAYGTVDFNEYDFGELVPEPPRRYLDYSGPAECMTLLDGHGQPLQPGQEPVFLPIQEGEPMVNSCGEPFSPAGRQLQPGSAEAISTPSGPHFKPVSLDAKPWIVTSYGCPE